MSELIDRRTAIKAIDALPNCYNGFSDTYDKSCIIGVLEEQPTIDAVPVVRCKECDNWATEFSSGRKSLGNYRCLCQEWSDAEDHRFTYTGENEYCSRGERREG